MKISFIGSGAVASNTAFMCGTNTICDEIVLLDINENYAKGKAIDLQQAFILNSKKDILVVGTNNYSHVKGSDAIVITAGVANKGNFNNREELLKMNKGIIEQVATSLKSVISTDEKQPLIIMVTNPLDIILKHFIDFGGFNKTKTIGSGNVLDTGRLQYYIAKELNVPFSQVETITVGQHGAKMVYLLSKTKVNGIEFFEYTKQHNISKETIETICKNSTAGSHEIISLLQKEGTIFGPAVSIYNLLNSYINNIEEVFPISVYCNGEYGVKDVCVGCPTILNGNGVKEVVEYHMTEEEQKDFANAVEFIRNF
ncbi:MAG: malate dehydrogenase [Rickettsiales bacterium]|nr:malate dehydrogenase [Rickettsiales bacterium]